MSKHSDDGQERPEIMIDTRKLREIAEKARGTGAYLLCRCRRSGPKGDLLLASAHCAAFNPESALKLLDRIEQLEAENRRLREALGEISEWSDDPESVSIARAALSPGIKKDGGVRG